MAEFLYLFWMEIKTRIFLMSLGTLIFIVGFISPSTCLNALSRVQVAKKEY
jgi:hypothetical protein